MPRQRSRAEGRVHRVAVIDDDAAVQRSFVRLVEREGHQARAADSAASGIELVREWKPHLVLLDFYLPDATGADVVRAIRQFDRLAQVLLVTGYAGEQPARKLLQELDIQGYHEKSAEIDRLLILIDSALKHYAALARIERQRRHLQHVLEVSPAIVRLQSIDELFQTALKHLQPLLGGGDAVVVTSNDGLLVLDSADGDVSLRAGSGRFRSVERLDQLSDEMATVVRQAIRVERPQNVDPHHIAVPFTTRDGHRGCLVVENGRLANDAIEACEIYAHQVATAIENVALYEMATVDPVTCCHNRAYGLERLEQTLRLASRIDEPTTLLMLDLDRFKSINDTHGHSAGDVMLRQVGRTLLASVRTSDLVARYGGDEFFVVLPATPLSGGHVLAERLSQRIASLRIPFEGAELAVEISLGVASAEPGDLDAGVLLKRADRQLYVAKRGAGTATVDPA